MSLEIDYCIFLNRLSQSLRNRLVKVFEILYILEIGDRLKLLFTKRWLNFAKQIYSVTNYLIEIFLLHNTLEEITSVVSSYLYQIYIKNKLAQHIPYFYFS